MIPRILATVLALLLCSTLVPAQDVDSQLARIKAVGREGAGNAEAAAAWKAVVRQGLPALPFVFKAFDGADPRAANWLRAAVEQIADDARAAKRGLPAQWLHAFVMDTRHAGSARRLAYEVLVRDEPALPKTLMPKLLDDPGAELRRDAVAVILTDAEALAAKKDPGAVAALKKVLHHARDRDQVEAVAKQLKALGVETDLTAHYGFVTRWLVAGPFDNREGAGFQAPYPPDAGVDPKAVYVGKDKQAVRWQPYTTTAKLGLVDFNKIYGEKKGVVAYAWTVIDAPTERPVELRAASNDAVRIYLNGKEVYFREEYHHGTELDQHVGKGVLRAGKNEILVKVCQNEQTDSWARQWSFQLRVCDALGAAVPMRVTLK